MQKRVVPSSPFPFVVWPPTLSKARPDKSPTDEYAAYRANTDIGDDIADQYIQGPKTRRQMERWRDANERPRAPWETAVPTGQPVPIPVADAPTRIGRNAAGFATEIKQQRRNDPEEFRTKTPAPIGQRKPPQRSAPTSIPKYSNSDSDHDYDDEDGDDYDSGQYRSGKDNRGWERFDSSNPEHIDEGADWDNGPKQPHAGIVPALGDLTYSGRPGGGVSFRNEREIPLGTFGVGIHKDAEGKKYFVKQGLVRPPVDFRGQALPKSAAARSEYMLHRLIELFATPDNGIRPVPGTLHSEERNGAPVPANYQWKFHNAGYSALPELIGNNGVKAQMIQDMDWDEQKNYMADLSKAMVVDALLASGDVHDQNLMAVPGEEGIYRLDLGAYGGMSPWGWEISDFYDDGASARLPFLPAIASRFDEAAHWMYGESGESAATIRKKYAKDILDQARHVVEVWDSNPEKVEEILGISHRYDNGSPDSYAKKASGGSIQDTMEGRVQALRNMIRLYGDHPDVLAADLMRALQVMNRSGTGDPDKGRADHDDIAGVDRSNPSQRQNINKYLNLDPDNENRYTYVGTPPGMGRRDRYRDDDYDDDDDYDGESDDEGDFGPSESRSTRSSERKRREEWVEAQKRRRNNPANWPTFVRPFLVGSNIDNKSKANARKNQFFEGVKAALPGAKNALLDLIKKEPMLGQEFPRWFMDANIEDAQSRDRTTNDSNNLKNDWGDIIARRGGKKFGVRDEEFGLTGLRELAGLQQRARRVLAQREQNRSSGKESIVMQDGSPAFVAGQIVGHYLAHIARGVERKNQAFAQLPQRRELIDHLRQYIGTRANAWATDGIPAEIWEGTGGRNQQIDYRNFLSGQRNRRYDGPARIGSWNYPKVEDKSGESPQEQRDRRIRELREMEARPYAEEGPETRRERAKRRVERYGRARVRRDDFARRWLDEVPDKYKIATINPFGTAFDIPGKYHRMDRNDVNAWRSNQVIRPVNNRGEDVNPLGENFEEVRDRFIQQKGKRVRARQRKEDWLRAAVAAGNDVQDLLDERRGAFGVPRGRLDLKVDEANRDENRRRNREQDYVSIDGRLKTGGTGNVRLDTENWMSRTAGGNRPKGGGFHTKINNPDAGNPWDIPQKDDRLRDIAEERPEEWVARRRGRNEYARAARARVVDGLRHIMNNWKPEWDEWWHDYRQNNRGEGPRLRDHEMPIALAIAGQPGQRERLMELEQRRPGEGVDYALQMLGGARQFASKNLHGRRLGHGSYWKFNPDEFLENMDRVMAEHKKNRFRRLGRKVNVQPKGKA